MATYGMVLNLNRCSGCLTCEVACKMVNGTRTGVDYTTVERVEWGQFPDAHRRYKINICMHCENASCIAACPTKASYATDEGVVLVDYDKCIGCGACVTACPYGARTLVTDQPFAFGDDPLPCEEQQADLGNIVEKCTFCYGRVQNGEAPMCTVHCPGQCRVFGDVDDPESDVSKYIESHNAVHVEGTHIWYVAPEGYPENELPKTPVNQYLANQAKNA